jgi:hypothetical protein
MTRVGRILFSCASTLAAVLSATGMPATVEEHFWGDNGNRFGVAGDYVGVSWFTTEVEIPPAAAGRRVTLAFESARMRAEVYVDERLAAYHLVDGTPFEADLTGARAGSVPGPCQVLR